ncbi:amine oxidase [Halothiobacillus diazotrophicus]|uniref:Amine oxidase n=1 Tax=Halothiobacillus diazotrophicus TaxID=1860122 RepID=A0A191ZEB7_9GAMM|nr:FAD-dependent oxidoreductase [Halothiobacillus diazotrophicus]ANJ66213.1 amine oxidase [Halothiobacillus diazotrophicus]
MLDTAIVGGGLSGLVLTRGLREQGVDVALYEARDRLGGRILSVPCPGDANVTEAGVEGGHAVDLGPTWFWPDIQPRMTRLVADLTLASFPQHDDGTVLHLKEVDKPAETVVMGRLHGGAQRLVGGMGALVGALAASLPNDALHLGHELIAVQDCDDHVALHFRHDNDVIRIQARRVVLTIPPRLLAERTQFTPTLDPDLVACMQHTPTWMADQAKVVIAFDSAFWRADGHSGNAFVSHDHVTLREVHDACDATGAQAALSGFFALTPEFRRSVPVSSLNMLVSSQLTQIFGDRTPSGTPCIQDWASEPFTCSAADRTPIDSHPAYGDQRLRQQLWQGKLHFGGSETAAYGGGYLEGALDAAARVQRTLAKTRPAAAPLLTASNANALAAFSAWVAAQRDGALVHYRQHLNRYLSEQQRDQLTQRALLDTVEQCYSAALDRLSALPLDMNGIAIERGRTALTPVILAAFDGFNRHLISEAVEFNRGSCALSNFGDEHDPDADYLAVINRDLIAAWREFALNANQILRARIQPSPDIEATARC